VGMGPRAGKSRRVDGGLCEVAAVGHFSATCILLLLNSKSYIIYANADLDADYRI